MIDSALADAVGVFEGPRKKLDRALIHLKTLEDLVTGFRRRHTCDVETVGNLDDRDARMVDITYVFREHESYPSEWALILSDLLNNLRSALDHAVWELAIRNAGPTPPNAASIAFPVCVDAAEFDRRAQRCLAALAPDDVAKVERLQPYLDCPPDLSPTDHPLLLLHDLNRLDKHRTLPLVRRWVNSFEVTFERRPPNAEVVYSEAPVLEAGALLARVSFERPPWPVGLDVTRTIAHMEGIAETELTPAMPLGPAVQLMFQYAVRAVASLDPC